MKLVATIDRIEESIAVLEIDHQEVDWPLSLLPPGAKEGQVVHVHLRLEDRDDSAAAKRLKRLDNKGPKGHSFNI